MYGQIARHLAVSGWSAAAIRWHWALARTGTWGLGFTPMLKSGLRRAEGALRKLERAEGTPSAPPPDCNPREMRIFVEVWKRMVGGLQKLETLRASADSKDSAYLRREAKILYSMYDRSGAAECEYEAAALDRKEGGELKTTAAFAARAASERERLTTAWAPDLEPIRRGRADLEWSDELAWTNPEFSRHLSGDQ
jgi:hypothetical protein